MFPFLCGAPIFMNWTGRLGACLQIKESVEKPVRGRRFQSKIVEYAKS